MNGGEIKIKKHPKEKKRKEKHEVEFFIHDEQYIN